MKRRNDSQREARDLTSQDIQACCRRNARCSELKTLCDSQNHQLIASIHILKCAKKNCIGLPTRWGEKKKSCPTVCCITWLHFLLRRRVSLFGTSEDRVRSTPTVFVCLALPWGQVSLWGGGSCRFVLDRKVIFGSNGGWQWCHECFLILRARVKFSTRDSPEFSCCSGRGGRGVEPTDVGEAGGVAAVALRSLSHPSF